MPGIDRDDVSRAETIGKAAVVAGGNGGRQPRRDLRGNLVEPRGTGIVAITVAEVIRQDFRDELKRKKEGIAGERCLRGKGKEACAEDAQGRTEQKSEG